MLGLRAITLITQITYATQGAIITYYSKCVKVFDDRWNHLQHQTTGKTRGLTPFGVGTFQGAGAAPSGAGAVKPVRICAGKPVLYLSVA